MNFFSTLILTTYVCCIHPASSHTERAGEKKHIQSAIKHIYEREQDVAGEFSRFVHNGGAGEREGERRLRYSKIIVQLKIKRSKD